MSVCIQYVLFSVLQSPVFCFINGNYRSLLLYWIMPAGKIAENNLDFKIIYDKEDELGKLCVSFEKMRQALQESNEEMWRQMEERKRLNAAFAHDLRTPLTVLKGQSELLRNMQPKMTAEKVSDNLKDDAPAYCKAGRVCANHGGAAAAGGIL